VGKRGKHCKHGKLWANMGKLGKLVCQAEIGSKAGIHNTVSRYGILPCVQRIAYRYRPKEQSKSQSKSQYLSFIILLSSYEYLLVVVRRRHSLKGKPSGSYLATLTPEKQGTHNFIRTRLLTLGHRLDRTSWILSVAEIARSAVSMRRAAPHGM
jgi:hypothetical protein